MPGGEGHAQVLMFSRDAPAAPNAGCSEDQNSRALNLLIVALLAAVSWGVIAFVSWAAI
jgi:hypothetical protein